VVSSSWGRTLDALPPLDPPIDVSGGDGGVLKTLSSDGGGGGDDATAAKIFADDGAVAQIRYSAREQGGRAQLLAASDSIAYTVGDAAWVPGFDLAVRSLKLGETARFECRADYAYGAAGLPPALPPNAGLVVDVEALDYRGNAYSAATFAQDAPLTPRTASAIREEYERRMVEKAEKQREEALLDAELGPIERAVKTFRSFYFFGFFESQTGERPPWYLRPLITFPAIFLAVALSFSWLLSNDVILLKGSGPTIPGEVPFTADSL